MVTFAAAALCAPGNRGIRAEVTVRRGAVISNAALAVRQATVCPGFGIGARYLQTGQVAEAGAAQRAQGAGRSRGARC